MNIKNEHQFQPILLGSDINVYGMARSFYEEYGVVSEAHSGAYLSPTKYSKIVNVHMHPNFNEPEGFISTIRKIADSYAKDPRKLLLIPCGDTYAELVSRFKEELSQFFICPTADAAIHQKLANKVSFYQTCEQYQLPHPKTLIITQGMVQSTPTIKAPFDFPVALKPADSIAYLDIHFEGRKKAFVIDNQAELDAVLAKIYQAGYQSEMICQDFIPGDDSRMRVLNAYVDQKHNVRMMCLGHPLLEDPTPQSVGNYVAIMPDYNEEVFKKVKRFLEDIKYSGFANFDMKYDERDGEYKLFEINLRQGRSSFFVTLGGYNLAKYLVEDYILEVPYKETVYGKANRLWIGVPKRILKKYISDGPAKEEAMKYLRNKQYGSTIFYQKDMTFKRYLLTKHIFFTYHKRFKKYFRKK